MSKFTRRMITIAAFAALIGSGLLLIGKALGGTEKYTLNINKVGEKIYTENDLVSGSIDLDKYNSVSIDTASMDIVICKGDSYKIEYSCPDVVIPEVSVEDNTLRVKQPRYNGGINVSFANTNYMGYKIYLPDNMEYNIDVEGASATITVSSVNVSGNISTSSGDIFLNDIKGRKMNLKFTSASVKVDNVDFEEMSFSGSSGDVYVSRSDIDEVSSKLTSGHFDFSKSFAEEISCEASSGDISIVLNTINRIRTNTTSGDVEINIGEKMDEYSVEVNTTSGSIEIGKNEYEDHASINSGADKSIDCQATSGDVKVSFTK